MSDEDAMIDRIMLEGAKAKLPPLDREILEARVSGALLREVAEEKGLCVESIRRREARALREIRCYFASHPLRVVADA